MGKGLPTTASHRWWSSVQRQPLLCNTVIFYLGRIDSNQKVSHFLNLFIYLPPQLDLNHCYWSVRQPTFKSHSFSMRPSMVKTISTDFFFIQFLSGLVSETLLPNLRPVPLCSSLHLAPACNHFSQRSSTNTSTAIGHQCEHHTVGPVMLITWDTPPHKSLRHTRLGVNKWLEHLWGEAIHEV